MHKLIDKGSWFAPKRYGFGAGLPIAWQGWALLGSYIGLLAGIGMMADSAAGGTRAAAFALFLIATATFIEIARRRTEGGWRWRWG